MFYMKKNEQAIKVYSLQQTNMVAAYCAVGSQWRNEQSVICELECMSMKPRNLVQCMMMWKR